MAVGLTPQQARALRYIAGYVQASEGVSPTYSEVRDALGVRSNSSVHRALVALEERGCIHRLPHRSRAVDLLVPVAIPRAPDGAPLYAVPLPCLNPAPAAQGADNAGGHHD